MVSIVLIMIVSFMSSAAVYFGSLYRDIMRQQRAIAGTIVTEEFARIVQRAREIRLNRLPAGGCPSGSRPANNGNLCFPTPSGGGGPTVHCVPHPLGNVDPSNPRLICIRGPGFSNPPGSSGAIEVTYNVVEPKYKDLPSYLRERFYVFRKNVEMGLDLIAMKLQNVAHAQASDTSYLPSLSGAPSSRLSNGLNCNPAGANSTYCKKCPGVSGANLDACVEVRVCVKPNGNCQNGEWIRRTIGLLGRD